MKKIYKVAFLIILGMFLGNCENKKADDIEKSKVINGLLVKIVTSNTAAASVVSVSSGCKSAYSSSIQGSLKTCEGCHTWIKDADSVITRITPSTPSTSPLYLKITSGTMASYSNTTINSDVLAWITSCKP
jgi:hypothetical protein